MHRLKITSDMFLITHFRFNSIYFRSHKSRAITYGITIFPKLTRNWIMMTPDQFLINHFRLNSFYFRSQNLEKSRENLRKIKFSKQVRSSRSTTWTYKVHLNHNFPKFEFFLGHLHSRGTITFHSKLVIP